MGWNYLEYRNRLVGMHDAAIAIAGLFILNEGRRSLGNNNPRLAGWISYWKDMAMAPGCSDLFLDEYLEGDSIKEQEFLSWIERARDSLATLPEELPDEYVNSLLDAECPWFSAIKKAWVLKLLGIVENLVAGRPIPDEWVTLE